MSLYSEMDERIDELNLKLYQAIRERDEARALLSEERARCERVAADEPNLPGPIPDHVRNAVEAAIANGKLEEVCRHFSGSMRDSILKKIQEGPAIDGDLYRGRLAVVEHAVTGHRLMKIYKEMMATGKLAGRPVSEQDLKTAWDAVESTQGKLLESIEALEKLERK